MPTRNVVLTEEQGAALDRLVASGRFEDMDEAVATAVELLEENEASMAALLARAIEGYEQAERGEFAPGTGEEAVRRAAREAREDWEAARRPAAKAS